MLNLESLRTRALALRSSIHNEHQLSAIELCGMVAKKTNEIIDVVNDLCDAVEKHQDYLVQGGLVYDQEKESLSFVGGEEK